MDIEDSKNYYRQLNGEEIISTLLNYDEAFAAIQDEVNHLSISENLPESVCEVLDRVEALARHRYYFRTEEQKENVKSHEFKKSTKIIDSFLRKINKKL